VADGETAKTAQLNAVPTRQGIAHGFEQGFDGKFGIAVGQLTKSLCQGFNQIGTCHGSDTTKINPMPIELRRQSPFPGR
jgi:hypothetical protein